MAVPARLAVPAALRWLLVVPGALWALVRTAGRERGPLPVQLMAFTPYAAALSTIPLVVALLARDWWASAVAGLACLALAVAVLPRAFGDPSTGTGTAARLTVMSANLRLGGADAASIVDLVRARDVDVLALQEFGPAARDALAAAGLTALLPYAQTTGADSAVGSAIYSRLPLSDGAVPAGPIRCGRRPRVPRLVAGCSRATSTRFWTTRNCGDRRPDGPPRHRRDRPHRTLAST